MCAMSLEPCVFVAFLALAGCGADRDQPAGADGGGADLAAGEPVDAAMPIDLARGPLDCGPADDDGGISGCATISGAMEGYSVPAVRSVIAVVGPSSFNVYIADRAGLCGILQAASSAKNTSFMRVGSVADTPQSFPAGVYSYPSGPGSGGGKGTGPVDGGIMGTRNAVIARSDDNCIFEGYDQASDGSFVLDGPVDATTTQLSGTFDVIFTVGAISGEIQGSFVAPVCPNATDITFVEPMYCE